MSGSIDTAFDTIGANAKRIARELRLVSQNGGVV